MKSEEITGESQNHRIIKAEKDIQDHRAQPLTEHHHGN